jgi:hypothetical protein
VSLKRGLENSDLRTKNGLGGAQVSAARNCKTCIDNTQFVQESRSQSLGTRKWQLLNRLSRSGSVAATVVYISEHISAVVVGYSDY